MHDDIFIPLLTLDKIISPKMERVKWNCHSMCTLDRRCFPCHHVGQRNELAFAWRGVHWKSFAALSFENSWLVKVSYWIYWAHSYFKTCLYLSVSSFITSLLYFTSTVLSTIRVVHLPLKVTDGTLSCFFYNIKHPPSWC